MIRYKIKASTGSASDAVIYLQSCLMTSGGIVLDRWVGSRDPALNRGGYNHPIDLEPIKEDKQLRPALAHRILAIPLLPYERANRMTMIARSGDANT